MGKGLLCFFNFSVLCRFGMMSASDSDNQGKMENEMEAASSQQSISVLNCSVKHRLPHSPEILYQGLPERTKAGPAETCPASQAAPLNAG